MRPNVGIDSQCRPRKQSNDQPTAPSASASPPTFFLATETDLARRGFNTSPPAQDTSPIRTLKQTLEETDQPLKTSPSRTPGQARREGSRRRSTIRPRSIEELRHEAIRQQAQPAQPISSVLPPSIPTSQEPSLASSPKSPSLGSLPKSEDDLTQDDYSSQAVESEDEEEQDQTAASAASLQDSAPQLIMPSIRMPSRRPFTERGKQLAKFKIMVVGSRGMYQPLWRGESH